MSTAVEAVALRARTGTAVNWTGAFMLYAKGATLQEIADQMGIPMKKIRDRFRADDWEGLVKANREFHLSAPPPKDLPAVQIANVEKRIEANRESSLSVLQGLRQHIQSILDQYNEQKIFLSPGDIATLSKAAATLNDASMTALGDDPAPKLPPPPEVESGPRSRSDSRPVTHFHINLPKMARSPRLKKAGAPEPIEVATSVQRNPILGPSPSSTGRAPAASDPRPAAVLAMDKAEDEMIEGPGGRDTVNFGALARNGKALATPVASGVPDFFR